MSRPAPHAGGAVDQEMVAATTWHQCMLWRLLLLVMVWVLQLLTREDCPFMAWFVAPSMGLELCTHRLVLWGRCWGTGLRWALIDCTLGTQRAAPVTGCRGAHFPLTSLPSIPHKLHAGLRAEEERLQMGRLVHSTVFESTH